MWRREKKLRLLDTKPARKADKFNGGQQHADLLIHRLRNCRKQ
jgi:hypothetical protein